MIDHLLRYVLLTCLILPAVTVPTNYTCVPGTRPFGVSLPRGNIFVKKGDTQRIECYLNFNDDEVIQYGLNASHLAFKSAKTGILNSTEITEFGISADYAADDVGEEMVDCVVNIGSRERYFCPQKIYVGLPPQNVTDFSCISEDWHSLNCTWKEPYNPIDTEYAVNFIEPGINAVPKKCPRLPLAHEDHVLDEYRNKSGVTTAHRNSPTYCYLDLTTNPPYRQTVKTYSFYVNASNPLLPGGKVFPIVVDHFSVVRPGRVPAIRLTADGPHQLILHYNISLSLIEFSTGLKQRVRYKDEYGQDWKEVDMSRFSETNDTFSVSVSDLTPYTNYTFSVQMISATANQSNPRLWSPIVYASARTNASRPKHSPRVNVGSFETLSSQSTRNVLVYWMNLSPWERNGPGFRYTARLSHNTQVEAVSGNSSYAKFVDLSSVEQEVLVSAENVVGSATQPSRLTIPQASFVAGLEPRSVTKVWVGEGTYRVAWRHPDRRDEVASYTLFWCKDRSGRDRPYQCDGRLDWRTLEVSGEAVQTYLLTLPENDFSYQIAVSANTEHLSSGMFWTTCTVIHNRVESRLKKIKLEAMSSTSVRVQWKLECSDQSGVVYGYRLDYCSQSTCESKDISANHEDYILTGLVPYTEYTIGVRIQNINDSYGKPENRDVRTLPDRPGSAPRDFKFDLEASSAKLSWQPPAIPNGEIGEYQIHFAYLNHQNIWMKQRTKFTNRTDFTLHNLLSFTRYEVNITACTQLGSGNLACSSHAASRHFVTAIGRPARPPRPAPKFKNSTLVEIEWSEDFQLGAPEALHWHVKIVRFDKPADSAVLPDLTLPGNLTRTRINLALLLPDWSPDCQNSSNTNTFMFSVRAVVRDEAAGTDYTGPWSQSASADAYCTPATNWFIFIGVPVIVLTVGSVIMCIFRVLFKSWHDTRQFFGEVAKDLDAKLVLPADNPGGDPVPVTEFEMTTMDDNSGQGNSGSESKDDDSDTLLLEDANNAGPDGGGKPSRQKSESESATSYLTSGCESFLSRGMSDCSHQFSKQISSNSSMPDHGSTCSGYVSMTRTDSNGSNGVSSVAQLAPLPTPVHIGGGSRHNSGPNRPVSAGPTLPTVTSSSLLSSLATTQVQSPIGVDTGLQEARSTVATAPLSAGFGPSSSNDPTRSVVGLAGHRTTSPIGSALQESRTSPGYSLVMSVSQSQPMASSNKKCNNVTTVTTSPTLPLSGEDQETSVPQIKFPAFTPPPDSLPPLIGTLPQRITTDNPTNSSRASFGRVPTTPSYGGGAGVGYTNTAAALLDETLHTGSSMPSSIPGFIASPRTDTAMETASKGLSPSQTSDLLLDKRRSGMSVESDDCPSVEDQKVKQVASEIPRALNFPKHSYISVQQVQELKPNPNHSAYTRIESCLESGGKSSESSVLGSTAH